MGKPGSVVSKTLTRFRVAALGRRTGCFFCMKKTLWADLHVGKFSRLRNVCSNEENSVIAVMRQMGASKGLCCSQSSGILRNNL